MMAVSASRNFDITLAMSMLLKWFSEFDAEKNRRRVVSLSWMIARPRSVAMTSLHVSMTYRLSRNTFDVE